MSAVARDLHRPGSDSAVGRLDIISVFSASFGVFGRRWYVFLGVSLASIAVVLTFNFIALRIGNASALGSQRVIALLLEVVNFIAMIGGNGIVFVFVDNLSRGKPLDARGTILRVLGMLPSLLVLVVVAGIVAALSEVASSLFGFVLFQMQSWATSHSGISSIFAWFAWLLVRFLVLAAIGSVFAVALPACAAEELNPLRALARSVQLTKGNRGRVFGLFVLGAFTCGVICFLFLMSMMSWALMFVAILAMYPVALIVSSFVPVVFGVLYCQLCALEDAQPRSAPIPKETADSI